MRAARPAPRLVRRYSIQLWSKSLSRKKRSPAPVLPRVRRPLWEEDRAPTCVPGGFHFDTHTYINLCYHGSYTRTRHGSVARLAGLAVTRGSADRRVCTGRNLSQRLSGPAPHRHGMMVLTGIVFSIAFVVVQFSAIVRVSVSQIDTPKRPSPIDPARLRLVGARVGTASHKGRNRVWYTRRLGTPARRSMAQLPVSRSASMP
jgi:hypothetical protein